MKFTVAARIIAGFSILALLLLIVGISSIFSLNNVSHSQTQVSQLALPAFKASNQLMQIVADIDSEQIKAINLEDPQLLAAAEAQLVALRQQFAQALVSKDTLFLGDSLLADIAPEAQRRFERFAAQNQQLLAALIENRQLFAKQTSRYQQIDDFISEAGGMLLDLADFADPNDANQAAAAAVAIKLEGQLSLLLNGLQGLMQSQDELQANTITEELDYLLKDIAVQADYMKAKSGSIDDPELMSDIDTELTAIATTLQSEQSLIQGQKDRLVILKQVATLVAQTSQQLIQLEDALDQLLQRSGEMVNELDSDVQSIVSTSISLNILLIIVSLAIALLIAITTIRSILRPLSRVNDILKVSATGDLSQQLDERGHDEFATLAKNINSLITSLRQLIDNILHSAQALTKAAATTQSVTDRTSDSVQAQKLQIDQVATATTELSSSSAQVASNAEETELEVAQADKNISDVQRLSEHSQAEIQLLAAELITAEAVITALNQESDKIGGVIDVIQGIAEQTNLLALNAAIEAARAGEEGRGFAVVADEVRNLASRTQNSTAEIQQMIEMLQKRANEAVNSMEKSSNIANNCVDYSRSSEQALSNIADVMRQINDKSSHINHAAAEQNQVSAEIHEKLVAMVELSEKTSQGAQDTSSASASVADLAKQLQASVARFKLEH